MSQQLDNLRNYNPYLYNISATAKYTTNRSLNLRLKIFHFLSEKIKKIKVPMLTTILIPETEQNSLELGGWVYSEIF